MGVLDAVPASLLSKEAKQPFLLVKLRMKQKDVDFSVEKMVLRVGSERDFNVGFWFSIDKNNINNKLNDARPTAVTGKAKGLRAFLWGMAVWSTVPKRKRFSS